MFASERCFPRGRVGTLFFCSPTLSHALKGVSPRPFPCPNSLANVRKSSKNTSQPRTPTTQAARARHFSTPRVLSDAHRGSPATCALPVAHLLGRWRWLDSLSRRGTPFLSHAENGVVAEGRFGAHTSNCWRGFRRLAAVWTCPSRAIFVFEEDRLLSERLISISPPCCASSECCRNGGDSASPIVQL